MLPPHPHFQVQYYFWGAELSCASSTHDWRIFHPEDECEDDLRHILFLKQATLGVNAIQGERNIVEVTSKDYEVRATRFNSAEAWSSWQILPLSAVHDFALNWFT